MFNQRTVESIGNAISIDRLRSDIETNATFGRVDSEGHGRSALPGTEANRKAREYLIERMEDAGLEVRIDPVGNIAGRWTPSTADSNSAPVAAGSHLDSVPRGGIFDGPLGVYAALETVRALQQVEKELARPIEVVCFTEEEGHRFGNGVLGSSVAAGIRDVSSARSTSDGTETLGEALDRIGFSGAETIDADSWDSWLELHVEQSEQLESQSTPAGIVSAIAGTTRCRITIEGNPNHAGTTSMENRSDALVAACWVVLAVEQIGSEVARNRGSQSVATVGELNVSPGAVNVIPGEVTLRVDIRDTESEAIEEMVTRLRNVLSEVAQLGVETEFERPYDVPPTAMSNRCQRALSNAATSLDIEYTMMPSGAGHDTMQLANATDVGMLFAPSRDGISHSPQEWTDWEDCDAAVSVLAGGIAQLACD